MTNKVPLRMKLFSTWETDRTTPNCTTRLCVLTVSRVTISKILGHDLSSIIVSVRMDSSKRTLKSNELQLQANGLLDTELELSFSLQYLHYLKRDSNRLNILLQRKNRYKNRTMLGYKTIAEGVIQMDQVLQKEITDLELDLFSNYKDKNACNSPVGKIFIGQVSSMPVDHDAKHNTYPTDRSGMYYSDVEDEGDSSSNGDEEVDLYDADALRTKAANPRHNFKQRFVSLLRKFKMTDSEGTRAALDDTGEIQALFNELESLSCEDDDSANDQDTMSISSTPKPCLRPFFSSSRSLIDSATTSTTILDKKLRTISDNNSNNGDKDKNLSGSDNNGDQNLTDPDAQSDPQTTSSPPREKDKKLRLFKTNHSTSSNSIKKKSSILSVDNTTTELHTTTIRKEFIEKVNDVFKFDENNIPEYIMLVFSSDESNTSRLIKNLESFYTLLNPDSRSEIKFVFSTLFSRLYKYCSHNNSNSRNWTSIKIILIGNNVLNSSCLRNYVDLLSTRPAEWQNLLQFFIVPLGNNFIAKYLAQIDFEYDLLFPHEIHLRPDDFLISLNNYIHSNNGRSIQIPIAEALLTCQDESSQVFIPFVHNVRIGSNEMCSLASIEVNDDNALMTSQLSNLLPLLNQSSVVPVTPPSSPNIQNRDLGAWDPPLELQLEYWPMIKTDNKNEKSKLDSKISIKGIFRNIYVTRLISNSTFTISFNLKEKKQKIMRLGKKKEKEKDIDVKMQIVENVSRLICSAKTQNNGMKVSIDGVEFNGVKFFQLSSMWPTHIKFLNISLMGLDVKI